MILQQRTEISTPLSTNRLWEQLLTAIVLMIRKLIKRLQWQSSQQRFSPQSNGIALYSRHQKYWCTKRWSVHGCGPSALRARSKEWKTIVHEDKISLVRPEWWMISLHADLKSVSEYELKLVCFVAVKSSSGHACEVPQIELNCAAPKHVGVRGVLCVQMDVFSEEKLCKAYSPSVKVRWDSRSEAIFTNKIRYKFQISSWGSRFRF